MSGKCGLKQSEPIEQLFDLFVLTGPGVVPRNIHDRRGGRGEGSCCQCVCEDFGHGSPAGRFGYG